MKISRKKIQLKEDEKSGTNCTFHPKNDTELEIGRDDRDRLNGVSNGFGKFWEGTFLTC